MNSAERARLFVALELPRAARDSIERWRAGAVRGVDGLRSVPGEALHATLCFLGSRERSEIDEIGAACARALTGECALELSLGHSVWLPRRRPRVLAVVIEDASGALAALQSALAEALSAGGWYAREERRFFGHVTVARVQRGARVRGVELPPAPSIELAATSVTLFRSRLEQSGARYEALRTVELGDRLAAG